jgi:hypothetical protein
MSVVQASASSQSAGTPQQPGMGVFTHEPGVPAVVSQVSVVHALPSLHCVAVVHCAAACLISPVLGDGSPELQPPAPTISTTLTLQSRRITMTSKLHQRCNEPVSQCCSVMRGPRMAHGRRTTNFHYNFSQIQLPPTQRRGREHRMPQPPQCELLTEVLTH